MRAEEFIREEDELNEVLPLVGLAAKAAGGMFAKGVGGALAKGAAKGAAGAIGRGLGRAAVSAVGAAPKGVGAAAKGVGAAAKGVARMAGATGQQQNAQTIGAPDDQPQGAASTDPARTQAIDRAKDQIIKPGANVSLPTDGAGGPEEFKISGMQGDEVEIENPSPAPGEPRKTIYKKDDIKRSMSL